MEKKEKVRSMAKEQTIKKLILYIMKRETEKKNYEKNVIEKHKESMPDWVLRV